MLKLCGYHSGHCRSEDPCTFEAPSFLDRTKWHVLAGQAFECVYRIPSDGEPVVKAGRILRYPRPRRLHSIVRRPLWATLH